MTDLSYSIPLDAVALSCWILSAYVASNALPVDQLGALIKGVHAAVAGTGQSAQEPVTPPSQAEIQASLGPGGILSFETGKRYTSLRRHLGSLGLSPAAYRERWGLPSDYPMVCPNYSAKRADIARRIGREGPVVLPTT